MDSGQFFCRTGHQLRMLPLHEEVRIADHHRLVYRWLSADYVQRYWHHAIDTLAAVAVRCKIAYYPIEAVEFAQKKLK
jgi:hypothetical protein